MNALRRQANPVGRFDVAAMRVIDKFMRMYCPNVRDVVFNGGQTESELRLGAAKLLGPRVPRLRVVRKAVKTVVPMVNAAIKDARRSKA